MKEIEQPYDSLPISVPHPLICRPLARRGFVSLLTALLSATVVLGLAKASRASPCALASLDPGVVAQGLERLAEAPLPRGPSGWYRLGALLPRRVAWTGRQSFNDGAGWYAGLDGGVSERALRSETDGWNLRLVWDLRPLWQPVATRPVQRWRDPLQRAEQLERLAGRLAHRLERLARLAQQAAVPDVEPGPCRLLQAQAHAQVMAARAALTAARRSFDSIGDRAGRLSPPFEPPARPAAGPQPPGRGSPP